MRDVEVWEVVDALKTLTPETPTWFHRTAQVRIQIEHRRADRLGFYRPGISNGSVRARLDEARKAGLVDRAREGRAYVWRYHPPDRSRPDACTHPRIKLVALGNGRYQCRTCGTVISPTHPDRL